MYSHYYRKNNSTGVEERRPFETTCDTPEIPEHQALELLERWGMRYNYTYRLAELAGE